MDWLNDLTKDLPLKRSFLLYLILFLMLGLALGRAGEALISSQVSLYNDMTIREDALKGTYTYHYNPLQVALLKAVKKAADLVSPFFMTFMTVIGFHVFYRHKIKAPLDSLSNEARAQTLYNQDEFSQSIMTIKALSLKHKEVLRQQAYDQNQLSTNISTLVHGLKSPLTVIKGNTEMLTHLSSSHPELYQELTQGLMVNVARIETYVEKLIHNESLQMEKPKPLEMKIEAFESHIIKGFKNGSKNIAIEYRRSQSDDAIYIDLHKMQECIEAVVDNCRRYSKSKIEILFEVRQDAFSIVIRDDGCGFSKEALAQGLNRYYSENPGDTNLGIGLFNAKTIVTSHGGRIALSNHKKGAEIKISLPISKSWKSLGQILD